MRWRGSPAARRKLLSRWERKYGYVPVDLPKSIAQRFYYGYANRTLWPLCHTFPHQVHLEEEAWAAYQQANEAFRDALLPVLGPGDLVWVHDYHLMLLPQMLRERLPQARIGFFLHIPFPSSDLFRILPRRDELLRGLLGADFLAFHTFNDVQHLRSSLLRVLGVDSRSKIANSAVAV